MQKLIDLFSHMFLVVRNYPKPVAEAEAAKLYVTAIKDARLAMIGVIALFSAIAAMVGGFCLFVLGLVAKNSPESLSTAAVALGGILFILPVIAFVVGLSQRFLLKVTKTDEVIKRIRDDIMIAKSPTPSHP
jgi:hypothetical protein